MKWQISLLIPSFPGVPFAFLSQKTCTERYKNYCENGNSNSEKNQRIFIVCTIQETHIFQKNSNTFCLRKDPLFIVSCWWFSNVLLDLVLCSRIVPLNCQDPRMFSWQYMSISTLLTALSSTRQNDSCFFFCGEVRILKRKCNGACNSRYLLTRMCSKTIYWMKMQKH